MAALLLALSLAPDAALAWGLEGHRIVGELAERQLRPETRAQVQALLAGEAEPTLAAASAWAEGLRDSDPDLHRRSVRWHFVNFPRGSCDYAQARDCPDGNCVIESIRTQADILSDRAQPVEARRQALKFLAHFVGDAHQPLHAAWGEDRGGNDHQVSIAGEGSNLHQVWDRIIIESAGLETSAWIDRLESLARENASGGQGRHVGTPADWALESCTLVAAEGFYPASPKIGDDYLRRHRPTVERRLVAASDRLARLIETALAEPAD